MYKILVTGGNGQLGSELQKIRRESNAEFIFTDIDTLDITNFDTLKYFYLEHKINAIINCAAYTAVDKAESDTEKAMLINRDAVKNLVNVIKLNKGLLLHISTDYVFDGSQNKPYKETDKVNPVSAYGKTKVEGETEALKYENTIIVRTAWLYSGFGNNIVKTILKLSKEREKLGFVFDQTGSPTYAEDLAGALLKIIEYTIKNGVKPGIYQYTNEGVCSWFDVAQEIVSFTKNPNCKISPIETHQYPTPATRPTYSVLNKQKIKDTFGIEIPYWRDSLHKCLNILINNN